MAVNTRDRRFSMLGLGLDALRVRPNPDGTISTTDRLHLLPLYRGIAAAGPSVIDPAAWSAITGIGGVLFPPMPPTIPPWGRW